MLIWKGYESGLERCLLIAKMIPEEIEMEAKVEEIMSGLEADRGGNESEDEESEF